MVQRIEILGQVNEDCCGIPLFRIFLHFLNCHLCTSSRSVAIASVHEQRFKDWGQLLGDCLLDDTVYNCRDSQLSCSAIRFRDFLPSHWLRLILSAANLVQKFFPVFPQPRQSILHCHSVNAGCSLIGLYPLVCSVQIASAQNSIKQVCTVRFFGFLSVSTPRSRILLVFRTIPLRAAPVSGVFCFLHTDLLPPFLRTYDCSALPGFTGTMASADFSQFVVTATRIPSAHRFTRFPASTPSVSSVRSPRVLTHSFTLIPAMFTANDSVQLLGFDLSSSLTLACGLT